MCGTWLSVSAQRLCAVVCREGCLGERLPEVQRLNENTTLLRDEVELSVISVDVGTDNE